MTKLNRTRKIGGAINRGNEAQRLVRFQQQNQQAKVKSTENNVTKAQVARISNLEQRLKKRERDELVKANEANLKAQQDAEDEQIVQELNLKKLDINQIGRIHNAQLRSKLQHEYNMQISGYRNFIQDINKDRGENFMPDMYNMALSNVPYVGDVVDALGLKVTAPKSEAKEFYNKQYQDLLEQYPELQDPLTGGSYHCSVCNKGLQSHQVKRHIRTKKHLEGAGIVDAVKSGINWVKDKFSKRMGFNNISTETLKKYGNCKVVKLVVAKEPIHHALDKIINFISLGTWANLKKQYSYDSLMHLGMIATVKCPDSTYKEIMIEKIDAVTISPDIRMKGKNVEYHEVPGVYDGLTLNNMMTQARRDVGDKTFFDYTGLGIGDKPPNNCQYFLKYLLTAVGLDDSATMSFVMQDVTELAKQMPEYSKKIMNAVTDAGMITNNILGKGKLTIHRVNVNKNIPYNEALKHAQHIGKTRRKFKEKVVGNAYHFKMRPKTHFKKGSFRSKKINKDITIVFAELI